MRFTKVHIFPEFELYASNNMCSVAKTFLSLCKLTFFLSTWMQQLEVAWYAKMHYNLDSSSADISTKVYILPYLYGSLTTFEVFILR